MFLRYAHAGWEYYRKKIEQFNILSDISLNVA